MADMLIAEELFLLTHDDESGSAGGTVALPEALAGALLLDLAVEGHVDAQGKDLLVPAGGSSRPEQPLLAATLSELAASDRPRSARHWVQRLPRALKPIEGQVGAALAERGVLTETEHRTLGLFPSTRFVQADPGPEAALRQRLRDVLVTGTTPDERTALLIGLLDALEATGRVAGKADRRAAAARAKEIREADVTGAGVSGAGVTGAGVTKAVAASVAAVHVAVMTAVTVPMVTTVTS